MEEKFETRARRLKSEEGKRDPTQDGKLNWINLGNPDELMHMNLASSNSHIHAFRNTCALMDCCTTNALEITMYSVPTNVIMCSAPKPLATP